MTHPACILTEEHRHDLNTKRGFPNELIDGLCYRSCRPENIAVLQDLLAQFGLEACLAAGIYKMAPTGPIPEGMLLQSHVLIFYLNEFGEAFHMRPHKLGLTGRGVHPYYVGTGHEGIQHCVLAESEFKAAASYQMGCPAIGIPGITVFSDEHFPRLVEAIRNENLHQVTVCFDNEIKNDPSLPNHKPDKLKRWDTQLYAILMAQKLTETKSFGEVKIATLPDGWMVNGKIDIDMVLASGIHTAADYQAVIANALPPRDYFKTLCDEARGVIQKKLDKRRLEEWTRVNYGRYHVKRITDAGAEAWESVSNFTFTFEAKTSTDNVTSREVSIKSDKDYEEPLTYKLTPEQMVSPVEFQKFLYGCGRGNYQFTGKPIDLAKIVDLEHVRARDEVIYQPDHVGQIEGEDDVWLFGNGALIGGVWIPADPKSGACWVGNKGFKAMHCVNPGERHSTEEDDPFVPMPICQGLDQVDLKDIAARLFKNYGGAKRQGYEALMAFCWNLATPFAKSIFRKNNFFPILYMLGEPESGKSRLGMWLLSMHGIQVPGGNADKGTSVGIERQLSYYSGCPYFLDELRNHGLDSDLKESLLRSVYDRSPIPKGLRTHGNESRAVKIRAPVMIGGEHRPEDEALNTRCLLGVFKQLTPADMASGLMGSEYDWFNNARITLLPKILPWLIIHGPADETVLSEIAKARDALIKAEAGSPRAAQNYAVPAAMYRLLISENDEIGFMKWLALQCVDTKRTKKLDSVAERFLEDLPTLAAQNKIQKDIHYRHDAGEFSLNFRLVYNLWLKEQPKFGEGLPGANSTREIMLKNPSCRSKSVFVGNSGKQCLVFYLTHDACPTAIKEWLGNGYHKHSEPAKDTPKQTGMSF